MATSLVLTRTPHRVYRIPYRYQPPPPPTHLPLYLVDHAPRYSDGKGIDNCRFYRLTTTPAILVLVIGTNRGTDVGYSSLGEAWETASGVFALPGTRGHPFEKNICIRKMNQVWTDFETDTQSNFTTAMNLALNQAAYKTAAGGTIS